MASSNVNAIKNCSYMFHEHHVICFSHTVHNSITKANSYSDVNRIFIKVHNNN